MELVNTMRLFTVQVEPLPYLLTVYLSLLNVTDAKTHNLDLSLFPMFEYASKC